jgi:hypothetical protein
MTTLTENLTSIPASTVARTVRKELKKAFPGVQFRVSGRRSAWLLSEGTVYVGWTDGPKKQEVQEIVGRFEGIKLTMDYAGYWDAEPIDNGDGTYYGVGTVESCRSYSDEAKQAAAQKMVEAMGASSVDDLIANFSDFEINTVYSLKDPASTETSVPYLYDYYKALNWVLSQG